MTKALDLRGTVNVETGKDATGQAKVTEVNPRFPASIGHTVLAECNMPRWTVFDVLQKPYSTQQPKIGIYFTDIGAQ